MLLLLLLCIFELVFPSHLQVSLTATKVHGQERESARRLPHRLLCASGARETLATMMDAEGETEFWESPPEENPLRTVVFYADIRYHSSPRSVGIDVDPMCDVCFLTKNSKTLLLAALLVQAPFPR